MHIAESLVDSLSCLVLFEVEIKIELFKRYRSSSGDNISAEMIHQVVKHYVLRLKNLLILLVMTNTKAVIIERYRSYQRLIEFISTFFSQSQLCT
jgi:hypothetical protein